MEQITIAKVYLCLNLVLGPSQALHPWSEGVLSSWWNGRLTNQQFAVYLSWPNSTYRAIPACIFTKDEGV